MLRNNANRRNCLSKNSAKKQESLEEEDETQKRKNLNQLKQDSRPPIPKCKGFQDPIEDLNLRTDTELDANDNSQKINVEEHVNKQEKIETKQATK